MPITKPEQACALLISQWQSGSQGIGSASVYGVPLSTNANAQSVVTIVTAKHNVDHPEAGKAAALLLKVNMPVGGKPRYVGIPLVHSKPRNYWISPRGLDLAVIPIPPHLIAGADISSFREQQILTTARMTELDVIPGMIAVTLCIQPEYLDPQDFLNPRTTPVARYGHLARLGLRKSSASDTHVIDIHSSPGNSGSTVIVMVPKKDGTVSDAMFLGIVQGFNEERSSYQPYKSPVVHTTNLRLVNGSTGATNDVALSIKTVANPNLTNVIPVDELLGLRESAEFREACSYMSSNQEKYGILSVVEPPKPK